MATPIRDRHLDRIVALRRRVLKDHDARLRVRVRLEDLFGQRDEGPQCKVLQQVLDEVTVDWHPEKALGQHDAEPAAGPQERDASLDKQDLRRLVLHVF